MGKGLCIVRKTCCYKGDVCKVSFNTRMMGCVFCIFLRGVFLLLYNNGLCFMFYEIQAAVADSVECEATNCLFAFSQ